MDWEDKPDAKKLGCTVRHILEICGERISDMEVPRRGSMDLKVRRMRGK